MNGNSPAVFGNNFSVTDQFPFYDSRLYIHGFLSPAFQKQLSIPASADPFFPKILLILKKNIPLLVFVLLGIVMVVVLNMAVEDEEPFPVDLIVAAPVIF